MDGSGLNPLLQNPGMIFHPPLLFMGYAGLGIPGCLALASSTSGERMGCPGSRPRAPLFLFRGCCFRPGIILGGWWAYMELGWGGYWGWDPVENASLLPWLFAAAALHIPAIERATGKLSRMAALFMSLTLLSAWFCHLAYTQRHHPVRACLWRWRRRTAPGCFLVCLLAICLLATICAPKTGAALDTIDSRQGALVLAAWIFVALALIIAMAHNVAGIEAQSGVLPHRGLRPVSTIVSACRFWRFCSLFLAFCPGFHGTRALQASAPDLR